MKTAKLKFELDFDDKDNVSLYTKALNLVKINLSDKI